MALLLLGVSALFAAPASAATFTASCSGTTGSAASLSTAIVQANTAGGPDTVRLGAGCTYTFTQTALTAGGWYGFSALPAIASDITVEGNGATIRAATSQFQTFRLFFVGADPAAAATLSYYSPGAGSLTLRNVTLSGGVARGGASDGGGGGAGMGGAIFSQGRVVIEGSALTANTARGGAAGNTSVGNGGGGMAVNSNTSNGGGMGAGRVSPQVEPQGAAGAPNGSGGGGGAGLRVTQDGAAPSGTSGGAGGGGATGIGGRGGAGAGGAAGDGSGGGGIGAGSGSIGGSGGDFGNGGNGTHSGGGGGVGGGGAASGAVGASGGGGGFGGGGGNGLAGGGDGGFGGGAGSAPNAAPDGAPGFGGGADVDAAPIKGGGGAGMGGAIFNMNGTLIVRNSTIAGNTAQGGDSPGSVDPGKGLGGAVFNLNGSFTAIGATIAGNTAAPDTPIDEGTAIYNLAYDAAVARAATTTLRNTIVGRGTGTTELVSNRSTFITPANVATSTVAVGERNLVRSRAAVTGGTITGTPLTADPLLGALAANGGPTATMAPAAGSPAIDAGSAFGLTRDQRGLLRPSDLPGVVNFGDAADIGAVELQAPARPAGRPAAFGSGTRITLSLAATRIPRNGPVPVRVTNRNAFTVTGRLAGQTTRRQRVKRGKRKRFVKLAPRRFTVAASKRKTVRLRLPGFLRKRLARTKRLSLRLSARVRDPAGNSRLVKKTVKPRLKVKRKRRSQNLRVR